MPRELTVDDTQVAALEDVAEAIGQAGFDPHQEGSLAHAATWLRRLGNNRAFLGDILIDQLASRHREDVPDGGYGPQVIMLVPPRGTFFIRANIWPSADEHMVRASGGASFVYGLPHDHNFDFLTLGYFGPGYWSDYYEADYAQIVGVRGERVPSLRFVERSRLDQGRILHYRAHRDIHSQHPADSLSVSLNVMHTNAGQGWLDQYRYDLDRRAIGAIVSPGPTEALLKVAVGLGSEEALDLAHRFARDHPSDRLRLGAWDALAAREAAAAAKDAVWRQAEAGGSRLVTAEAAARRAMLAL